MRRPRVLSREDGFTLVETMLTLVILSVGLTALAALQITAIKANAFSKRMTAATLIAEATLEQLKDAPYANVQSVAATPVVAANMNFTRQVTVTANSPMANAKTVLVAVRWTEGSQTRTVPFTTILYHPSEDPMFTSERGFSVIELLIALAISGIVTAGLYGMAISSSRHYVSQNGVIGLQADGRAAMEFMARDLRRAFGSPTLATTVTTNDTISFDRVEDSGRASGGTTTTLNDDLKAWTPGAMAPPAASAHTLRIIAGTGAGQTRTITANTATQLTVSPALGTAPDTNSLYVITTARAFTKTSSTDHTVRYRVGTTGDHDPLAENITSLAFALPNATTMTVTLTARTKGVDPTTNQYRYYTLTETIRRRNS